MFYWLGDARNLFSITTEKFAINRFYCFPKHINIMNLIHQTEQKYIHFAARLEVIIAMIIQSFAQLQIKTLTSFSISQLLTYRGILIMTTIGIMIKIPRIKIQNKMYPQCQKKQMLVILQTFLMAFQCFLFFFSIRILTLSETLIIYNTYNIWACLTTQLLLKQNISLRRYLYVFLSITGLIFVIKPDTFFQNQLQTNNKRLIGMIVCLLASFINGFSISLIKLFGNSQGPLVGLQYFQFFCALLGSIDMCINQTLSTINFQFSDFFGIIYFSSFGLIALFLLFRAYSLQNSAILAPYTYTNVLMIVIIDSIYLKNIPDIFTLIGCLIIIGSGMLSFLEDQKEQQ